jgi:16S rRNA (cytidine1402-2'-O)-methyltransferase
MLAAAIAPSKGQGRCCLFTALALGAAPFRVDDVLEPMTRMPNRSPSDRSDPKPSRGPSPPLEPGLYVVSTPIGNLGDITRRAIDTLERADLVLAEDTRVARKLLSALGISARVEAYHDHSGPQAGERALSLIAEGGAVALTSDAGTPLLSDPGFPLVQAATARGFRVVPVPGASALLAAMAASGLPTDRFLFVGFLPAKSNARRAELGEIATLRATLAFYETGPRLAASLSDMAAVLGDRAVVVGRELTKLYEEFRRGRLFDLATAYEALEPPKGEIVVMVGPPEVVRTVDPAEVDAALVEALATMRVKDASRAVALRFGLSSTDVYGRALVLQKDRR